MIEKMFGNWHSQSGNSKQSSPSTKENIFNSIPNLSAEDLRQLEKGDSLAGGILDSLPILIRVRNDKGRVIFRNKAASLFDSCSENLNHLLDMVDWGADDVLGNVKSWIQPWLGPDRSILHYSCKRIPILDKSGTTVGSLEYAIDVSEKKDAHVALLELEEKFRIFVEKSSSGIFILRDDRIVYCNARLAEIFGYTVEELQAMPSGLHLNLISEQDRERIRETLISSFTHRTLHIQQRYAGVRKDGSTVHIESVGGVISIGGMPCILGTLVDISEHVKVEEKIHFAHKLEAAGQIAGGIAHDFNNLLTIIKGSASILSFNPALDDGAKKHLAQIQEAADKSIAITNGLLQMGKRRLPVKKRIALRSLMSEWVTTLLKAAPDSVDLSYDLCNDPLEILGDKNYLESSVMSIFMNAFRSLPESKGKVLITLAPATITPAAPLVQLGRAATGHYASISVTNDGPSLSDEAIAKIFEPIFTSNADSPDQKLGLSMAYGVVNKHGGWIDVTNQCGEGNRFTIYLPLAPADEGSGGTSSGVIDAPRPMAEAVPIASPIHILVVEDEEIIRSILDVFLHRLGYEVLQASSAEEGIAVWNANREKISLLLSDIVMPGEMNGAEMACRFVEEKESLKVIFMSGYNIGEELPKGPNFSFIAKPFAMDQVAETVKRMLADE